MKNRLVNIIFIIILAGLIMADFRLNVTTSAYLVIAVLYLLIQTYGSIVLSANFFIDAVVKGKNPKGIALTFDDGPIPGMTERILDILKENNVKGAFFCIGRNVQQHPGLLQRIHGEGHLIANHSYNHGKMFDLQPASSILNELQNTDQTIQKTIGLMPRFFRPPYGVTNPMVAKAITTGKYVTVGWTIRSFDTTSKDSEKLFNQLSTKNIAAGDIVLFHDYSEPMIQMLPRFIQLIKTKGLEVMRLDELINEKAYA